MTHIETVIQNLREFLSTSSQRRGFFAGNGRNSWIKCVDLQTAKQTGFTYIFFVENDGKDIIAYQS